jgi:hypothetical protein
MHWPEPVKKHITGSGKVLSSGLALLAAVFGVLVAGLLGIGILVGALLLFLLVELWMEDGRKEDAINQGQAQRRELEKGIQGLGAC